MIERANMDELISPKIIADMGKKLQTIAKITKTSSEKFQTISNEMGQYDLESFLVHNPVLHEKVFNCLNAYNMGCDKFVRKTTL